MILINNSLLISHALFLINDSPTWPLINNLSIILLNQSHFINYTLTTEIVLVQSTSLQICLKYSRNGGTGRRARLKIW